MKKWHDYTERPGAHTEYWENLALSRLFFSKVFKSNNDLVK
jgi:hypothetical protein